MVELEKRIGHWPIYQYICSLLGIAGKIVLLLSLIFLLISIAISVNLASPNESRYFHFTVSLLIFGFIIGAITSLSFYMGRYPGNKAYQWILGDSGVNKEETKAVMLHFIIYPMIAGAILSILALTGEESWGIITDRMNSEPTLNRSEIEISISVLKMTALFLPVWATFIGIGIRTYVSKDGKKDPKNDQTILPHQFTSIAVLGYFGILGIIIASVWALLPTLPYPVAISLLILIVVLSVVGLGIYYVDKSLLEDFSDEEQEQREGRYYPRIKQSNE